ncbi:MAG TPA: hypothetical protein VN039_06545 [Nitrospira sp.]|nr:hypothetical protein [Nitrospira sp.]
MSSRVSRTYQVHNLVYFEQHEDMRQAVQREKQIKKWNRAWKIEFNREDQLNMAGLMAEHLLTTWIPAVDHGPSRHSRMLQAGIQKVRGLDARFRVHDTLS